MNLFMSALLSNSNPPFQNLKSLNNIFYMITLHSTEANPSFFRQVCLSYVYTHFRLDL